MIACDRTKPDARNRAVSASRNSKISSKVTSRPTSGATSAAISSAEIRSVPSTLMNNF
jgi:hypothetical protein